MQKLVINSRTLTEIKDYNPFKEINSFKTYDRYEIQQILMVMSFIDFAKQRGLISKDLEVVLE